jgi:uncharacterized membrane protein YphA (DoxX/SURF4 family)
MAVTPGKSAADSRYVCVGGDLGASLPAPSALAGCRRSSQPDTPVNVALWVIQGWLAASFLLAGGLKLARSKQALERVRGMEYVGERSATEMKLIGLAEVVGAVGLVIPSLLQILPVLTSVAAACLAVLMLGAVVVHLRRGESAAVTGGLLALSLVVAVGRSGWWS